MVLVFVWMCVDLSVFARCMCVSTYKVHVCITEDISPQECICLHKHIFYVQVVCNADLMFMDVVARWPGSVNARIPRQSAMFAAFEGNQKPVNGFILADSGYMLREWLLTPFPNPRTEKEQNYNNSHSATRATVERAIGCAKRRWHCLRGLRVQPEKAADITIVCLMLHNRARSLRLPEEDFFEDMDDIDNQDDDPHLQGHNLGDVHGNNVALAERVRLMRGRAVRDNLVQQFF